MRFGRRRRNSSDHWSADAFAVDGFKLIANDTKSARLKLINVPEITATAMLFQPQNKEVIAAAIDARSGIALCQQPDVAPIVLWPISFQQRDLQCAGLGLQ